MSVTIREMKCRPDDVFAVLRDGWLFATWVVGASRIREVDDHWPNVRSHLYHSVGVWPLLINDSTEVEEVDPPHALQLKARAWPSGEARIRLEVEPVGDITRVTITEKVIKGPARFIPGFLEHGLLHWRNTEALRRLAYLAERGARS